METNKTMSQHTPTPWEFKKIANHGARITDSKDFTIAIIRRNLDDPFDNAKKDSEFIVTAVNAHEDLVKALKQSMEMLEAIKSREESDPEAAWRHLDYPIFKAKQALEKAGVKV